MSESREEKQRKELQRIQTALKINPLDILNLPTTFCDDDVKKAYRKITTLVHPDRCHGDLKAQANEAFPKVTAAKKQMDEEHFRNRLTVKINEARRLATQKKVENQPAKRRKLEEQEDFELPAEEIETEAKEELRSLLIDDAWRQYMYNKAAVKLEKKVAIEKDQRKILHEAKKEAEEKWKEATEQRVNNWRDWNKSKKKKKKKRKRGIKTNVNVAANEPIDPLQRHEMHLKNLRQLM